MYGKDTIIVFAQIVAQDAYFFEGKIQEGHYFGRSLFPVLPPLKNGVLEESLWGGGGFTIR